MDKWLRKSKKALLEETDEYESSTSASISVDDIPPVDNEIEIENFETDHSSDENDEPPIKKKRKLSKSGRINKYCKSWEDIPEFKNWLKKSKLQDLKGRHELAECKICNCTITAHKYSISRHRLSEKHRYHSKQICGTQKISDMTKKIDFEKK
ncbi:hypothetical protein JTB14_006811 [Gonioctena quinquepunctata]|nr:hypothetical protein JTB14_006811 [Gonioctena quinquepunctata]